MAEVRVEDVGPAIRDSDNGLVVHQLNSLLSDYQVLQQQNAYNRSLIQGANLETEVANRRANEAEEEVKGLLVDVADAATEAADAAAEAADATAENNELRKRIRELEEENIALKAQLDDAKQSPEIEIQQPSSNFLRLPGMMYTHEDPLSKIDIKASSSDTFITVVNTCGDRMLNLSHDHSKELGELLKVLTQNDDQYRNSTDHSIEFFNDAKLKWEEMMKTSTEELQRPLAPTQAQRIERIRDIMASYNKEGNEFEHLASLLEGHFSKVVDILNKHPLGDEKWAKLITDTLLTPVSKVINAKYRVLLTKSIKDYNEGKDRCEQLSADPEEKELEEQSVEEDISKEIAMKTELYQILTDVVLRINSEIRALINGDDCVEKTLRPELEGFKETAKEIIESQRGAYNQCIASYTDDTSHIDGLIHMIDDELKTETDLSSNATDKYLQQDMSENHELAKQHIRELLDLFKREDERRLNAFRLSLRQEAQVRRLALHRVSCDHVKQQLAKRQQRLDTYHEMMKAGIDALQCFQEITDTGIPGLIEHIKGKMDKLIADKNMYEQEFITYHTQSYLLISDFIVLNQSRIAYHNKLKARAEADKKESKHLKMVKRVQKAKMEINECSEEIRGEEEEMKLHQVYLDRVNTVEAQHLYGTHKAEYPFKEARRRQLRFHADLNLVELEKILLQEQMKQKVIGGAVFIDQNSIKTTQKNVVNEYSILVAGQLGQIAAAPSQPQNQEQPPPRKGEDEQKHDYADE